MVPAELDGDRVDRTIARLLGVTRSQASAMFEPGVTIDGSPASPSDRVQTGQVLRCPAPRGHEPLEPEPVDFAILYEDRELLVVDKPPGLVVHPGSAHKTGTLAAGLIHRYPELAEVGPADRAGLVHRLDKDTSGTLLVARTPMAFEALSRQMRSRHVKRTYTTLVEGLVGSDTGTIDAPIGPDPARPTRRALAFDGKPAVTHYEVLRRHEDHRVTLLSVELETGRTHQIRVHLAAIGHPVVGDVAYGASRRDLGAPRTFLHASRLELTHPLTGEALSVDSPLPSDLTRVLHLLA